MELPIQLTNETDQVIVQTGNVSTHFTLQTGDPIILSIIMTFSTLALAIIAIVTLWKSHKSTQESNKETRKSNVLTMESNKMLKIEIESRFRPVLIFEKYGRTTDTQTHQFRFWGHLRNFGTVPARDVKVYNYSRKQTEISIRDLVSNENKNENIKKRDFRLGTIIPNLTIEYESVDSFERDSKDWFLSVWLEYEFLDDKKEEIIHIFKIRTDTDQIYAMGPPLRVVLIRSFVDMDIKKARDEWNDLMGGKISSPS